MALAAVAFVFQMAKISLNSNAPTKEKVHFSFGGTDFDLDSPSAVYESDDPAIIAAAGAHDWLVVKIELPKQDERAEVDMTDPHNNPKVDHLSSEATAETIAKAEAEAERIREEVNPQVQDYAPEQSAPVEPQPDKTPTEVVN